MKKNILILAAIGALVAGQVNAAENPAPETPSYLKQDKPAEGGEAAVPVLADFPIETKEQRDARMAWWREARFGMFIHWGVYARLGGIYDGKEIPSLGEQIMGKAQIPVARYKELAREFNPVKYNAEEWVLLAKRAGMKYIVITAKHVDGFALWPSAANDWDVESTLYKKDLLKPLAEACKKHGIKLGFYYAQTVDWSNGGACNNWDPEHKEDIPSYMKNVALPQLKELATNYGDFPDILWWDVPVAMKLDYAKQILEILKVRPDLIQNNRLFKMHGHMGVIDMASLEAIKGNPLYGDTETPEQYIPPTGLGDRDFEVCMTMNDTWGYKSTDHNWKSSRTLIHQLIDIASKGGNYLLNVGPTGEGLIPDPIVERLKDIGTWMAVNSESIYGTTASSFPNLTWGRSTTKKHEGGATLYLHVFNWPQDGKLLVPGLKNEVKSARLLAGGADLEFKTGPRGVFIDLPADAPDANASVIRLEIVGEPKVVPLAPPLSQGKSATASSQYNQPGYEAAKAVDGEAGTRWASESGARSGWLEVDLGEQTEFQRVWLSEIEYPETREFAIKVKQGDAWKEVARGTTIGADKEITFPPVKARLVRLNVLKADGPININEFQVFAE